jgi:hypothetical protein
MPGGPDFSTARSAWRRRTAAPLARWPPRAARPTTRDQGRPAQSRPLRPATSRAPAVALRQVSHVAAGIVDRQPGYELACHGPVAIVEHLSAQPPSAGLPKCRDPRPSASVPLGLGGVTWTSTLVSTNTGTVVHVVAGRIGEIWAPQWLRSPGTGRSAWPVRTPVARACVSAGTSPTNCETLVSRFAASTRAHLAVSSLRVMVTSRLDTKSACHETHATVAGGPRDRGAEGSGGQRMG